MSLVKSFAEISHYTHLVLAPSKANCVVLAAELIDSYTGAFITGMNEFSIATNIDANMGEGRPQGIKSHQVAGPQFRWVDLTGRLGHCCDTSPQLNACCLKADMRDSCGTVIASCRTTTT